MARRKQGREVVYVERGGDASAKWLFWGAVLGAGLALMYAPRTGEETRRVLQRKLWKLRAVTEEKLDELAQQFGERQGRLWTTWRTRRTTTSRRPASCRRSGRAPPGRRPARSSSGGWPSRARAGAPWAISRSRSPETAAARRVAPHPRRFPAPNAPGRGRKQHSLSRQRADVRCAAGGRAVRPARADRPDARRAGHRGRTGGRRRPPSSTASSRRIPPTPGRDPFALVERLLVGVARNRGQISLFAAPGVRLVQHPALRRASAPRSTTSTTSPPGPSPPRNFLLIWLAGKVRDSLMVIATVVLFLANTALSTVVTIAWARGEQRVIPQLAFFFSDPRTVSGRAARVRLLGVAVLRHLPLRLGPASPLADRAAGLHLHRAAVRGGQAAVRALSRPLRVGREAPAATPISARPCCSSSGSTTPPSSSCSAAWSPRPGSCGTCRNGSVAAAVRYAGTLRSFASAGSQW